MHKLHNVMLKILELTENMQANLELNVLFDIICKAINEDLGWNFAIIVLRDKESRTSAPVAARGMPERYRKKILGSKPSKWTNWYKIPEYQVSNSYYVRDVLKNLEMVPEEFRDRMSLGNFRSDNLQEWQGDDLLMIPIRVKDEWIGMINVDRPLDGMAPTIEDIKMLELFANQVAIAINNAKAFEKQKDFNKRLAIEIEHKTKLLEEQNRELQTYISSLTHDLKTPLVSINALLTFLNEDIYGDLESSDKEYFNRLSSNVVKMSKILNDLVSYYNIQKTSISKDYINLKALINEEFNRAKDLFPEKKTKLELVGEFPFIYQERLAVSLVFSNLLSNAMKFSKSDDNIEISVGVENFGTHYQFYVKDNGIGLDIKYTNKIFKLFERLADKKTEGTGIGLATVQKMIDKMGGKIWVESEKDNGSTFFFTIPIIEKNIN
ncbi:MAG TPA: GAF domain-containing sensor histidine kinase [Candidatus Methanofastidiosa archaeon]|nr:GAF domain-containing sensor histidine kinase [Candidatus Methanofastidiosa archaeon]